ncbi:microfibril-associated glycoprotein 4-like [Amphiura filiformis]|uniref:microfibril-associated glycoprotein 4-like n=1 Tax=Amphiura filiformis TaxID=82378 RepID=UPI003B213719
MIHRYTSVEFIQATVIMVEIMRALQLTLPVIFIIVFPRYLKAQNPDCGSVLVSSVSCIKGYALTALVLLSVPSTSKNKCLTYCMHKTGCKSVNLNTVTKQCDLLGSNRNDLTPQHLITTSNTQNCDINSKEETKPRSTAIQCQATGADCAEIFNKGYTTNAVYSISPAFLSGGSIDVMCDMDNGGWIVIQQRFDGSVSFDRDWITYQSGFGAPPGEYWIGLDTMQAFTNDGGTWKLRVDIEDWHNNTGWAEYSMFLLESQTYTLRVSGYSGNIGNSLQFHDLLPFSTRDNDNDNAPPPGPPQAGETTNCALDYLSGWWYDYCLYANLNGLYYSNQSVDFNHGIQWETWITNHPGVDMNSYSMKSASMKIQKL